MLCGKTRARFFIKLADKKMQEQLFRDAKITHYANPNRAGAVPYPAWLQQNFSLAATADALHEISSWSGYQPTPLARWTIWRRVSASARCITKTNRRASGSVVLRHWAARSRCFDCCNKKFTRIQTNTASSQDLEAGKFRDIVAGVTVVTATDGNHGRSVAWGAGRFGCRCRIYIHAEVSERRAEAMRELGAEIVRIDGNYDDSVRRAAADAAANDWQVVSDTSYPGYTELPGAVMAGYSVMMEEIVAQSAGDSRFTHVFVQGGVGGLAASMAAWLWEKFGADRPRFIVVEPDLADCLMQSARNNRATEVRITRETIMAGLSCGEVSELAWQVLSRAADDFMTISDELVAPVMAALAYRAPPIEAGESAVAGLAGCMAACADKKCRHELNLDAQSRVLVFGSEGATDREIYERIIAPFADGWRTET